MDFYKHARASTNLLETYDVIGDWRHWLAVDRGQERRILFIASGKILQLCILQYSQPVMGKSQIKSQVQITNHLQKWFKS